MNDPVRLLLAAPSSTSAGGDKRKEHTVLGLPVLYLFYVGCICCTGLDIVEIVLGLSGYFYPAWFRRTPLHRQVFQKADRHEFATWYNVALLAWVSLFFVHILATGLSQLSLQMRRPFLFLPQFFVLLAIELAFLAIFAVSTTISAVGDDTMFLVGSLSLLFLLLYGVFLCLCVLSFQSLMAEYAEIQRILAKSKSVHFKEKRRRK